MILIIREWEMHKSLSCDEDKARLENPGPDPIKEKSSIIYATLKFDQSARLKMVT